MSSPSAEESGSLDAHLLRLFGENARIVPLASADRMGRRVHGVDLAQRLRAEEATLLVPNDLVKTVAEKSFDASVSGDTVVLPGIMSRKKQIIPNLAV